jgi:hypothetical protein
VGRLRSRPLCNHLPVSGIPGPPTHQEGKVTVNCVVVQAWTSARYPCILIFIALLSAIQPLFIIANHEHSILVISF